MYILRKFAKLKRKKKESWFRFFGKVVGLQHPIWLKGAPRLVSSLESLISYFAEFSDIAVISNLCKSLIHLFESFY